MPMTLLLEECVRSLSSLKEAMEEKGLRVNAGKTTIMVCGTGLDLMQASFHAPCVAQEWAATESSEMAANTGAQEMQWAQALDKGP